MRAAHGRAVAAMESTTTQPTTSDVPARSEGPGALRRLGGQVGPLQAGAPTRVEILCVGVLLALFAAWLFGNHILHGGFYSDDWSLASATADPEALNYSTALGYYIDTAGARITAAFYWLALHGLFGLHAKAHLAVAAGLGVVMSLSFYFLLRELRVERVLALAIILLSLAWPAADTVRVWATPALSQLALASWAIGVVVALHAFRANGTRARWLHVGSLALYLFGASITEGVVPFVVMVSPLLYLTVAPWRRALPRWLVDVVLAAAAGALIVRFTTDAPEREVRGLSGWWDQGHTFVDQAVTLFAHAAAPFVHGERWTVSVVAVAIVVAGAIVARTGSPEVARAARRWLAVAGIAIVGIAAGYAIYLPADPYYYPLQEGLAGRVNIGVAVPFATLFVALAILAALTLFQWASDARRVALTAAAAYAVILLAAFVQDLRIDLRVWDRSADEQYQALNSVRTAIPDPDANTTIFAFGQGGVVTPGLPVFTHPWELSGALQASYGEGEIAGVPMIEGRGVLCGPNDVAATVLDTSEVLGRAPYGLATFVDVPSGRAVIVRNRTQCRKAAPTFAPGPFVVPNPPPPPSQL